MLCMLIWYLIVSSEPAWSSGLSVKSRDSDTVS